MSTNRKHPRFAFVDAVFWPLLIVWAVLEIPGSGIVGPVLAGGAAVWGAMRLRRAAGHGRQPYYLSTHRVLRFSVYWVLFGAVLYVAVNASRH